MYGKVMQCGKHMAKRTLAVLLVVAMLFSLSSCNIVQRIPYPDNEYNNNAAMMPDKYKDGTRDQQSNLYYEIDKYIEAAQ